jgi:hypothetical protein
MPEGEEAAARQHGVISPSFTSATSTDITNTSSIAHGPTNSVRGRTMFARATPASAA